MSGALVERVLAARAPFDGAALLAFLVAPRRAGRRGQPAPLPALAAARARRRVATLTPAIGGMQVELDLDDARDEDEALAQLSALLDLDAPAAAIADGARRATARSASRPGCASPAATGYEIAVRAVLEPADLGPRRRTHAGRLVAAAGEPLARPRGTITHLFPTAEAIAAAPDAAFAMPARRRDTLRSLAGAPLDDLISLPGIGPWTQAYVAMRALRDRDAWLPTDLGVRHALTGSATTATPSAGARTAPTPSSTSGT